MQVVLPSVSRADVLHGTAFTVSVASPSSADLDMPTVVPGFCGLPTTGADPASGTLGGGAAAAGGVVTASAGAVDGVCAHADDDSRTSVATKITLRIMRLLASEGRQPAGLAGPGYPTPAKRPAQSFRRNHGKTPVTRL